MARSRGRAAPAPSRAPLRSAPTQIRPQPQAPAQRPHQQTAPAPQQSGGGGGMLSGFASTIAQGFAFGTGSAVAHRAVGAAAGAMTGSGSSEVAPHHQDYNQQQQHSHYPQQSQPQSHNTNCQVDQQNFMACLNQNAGNIDACQFYFESLQMCQRNQSAQM